MPKTENELINEHMGLVVKLARWHQPRDNAELEDFIQEGNIALLKAIRNHDPTRSKLSTLAWTYINKALKRYKLKNKRPECQVAKLDVLVPLDYLIWEIIPNNLTQNEHQVFVMRCQGYTLQEIGQTLGYTKEWTSRTLKKIIQKIKEAND